MDHNLVISHYREVRRDSSDAVETPDLLERRNQALLLRLFIPHIQESLIAGGRHVAPAFPSRTIQR